MVSKSDYPTVAGVLLIIAACICLILGVLYTWVYHGAPLTRYFGFLGFAFGSIGGIFALKRRGPALTILGIALVMAEAIFSLGAGAVGLILGMSIIYLAAFSVTFTEMSGQESRRETRPSRIYRIFIDYFMPDIVEMLGTASLVLGIVGFAIAWIPFVGLLSAFLLGPLAALLGAIAICEGDRGYGFIGIALGIATIFFAWSNPTGFHDIFAGPLLR